MKSTITYIFSTLLAFFLPVTPLLLTMIGFIALDTLTALYVTYKLKGRKSIRSHKFFSIVPKSFLYCASIILAFCLDKFIIGNQGLMGIQMPLSKSMMIVFVLNEISSLNENSMKLGNRSFWVIIGDAFNKLKNLKKDLNEIK